VTEPRIPIRPRFYFSLRSPYSWLAYRLAERHFGAVLEAIEFVPFWEPDEVSAGLLRERDARFLYTPMSRAKHLYLLHDVRRLAARYRLPLRWPVDTVSPWWELPHLAYLVAERAGRAAQYRSAMYRARWEQGRDICTPAVVADVAEAVGVDPAAALGAPADPVLRAAGAEALARAYRDGVFGVPFFRVGREPYWGVDRLGDFAAALGVRIPAQPPPGPPGNSPEGSSDGTAPVGSGTAPAVPASGTERLAEVVTGLADAGHAGGCG
jgi:2-hydroxychromene-2-carboxylate isomerase